MAGGLAARQREQAGAVEARRIVRQPGQLQQRRHQILVLVVTRHPHAARHGRRIAQDQGHVQHVVVQAVVIEPALVVVQGLAVVAVYHHDGLVQDPARLQSVEDPLNRRVHVGDGAVVLGDHVILVGDSRRHPGGEVVAERLERPHRLHGTVAGVALVAVVEDAFVGVRRQVGGVRVHVPQEQQKGIVRVEQPVQLRQRHLIQELRLGGAPAGIVAPRLVVEVGVEAARAGVAAEADAGAGVAVRAQQLRQGGDRGAQRPAVAQRHHLRAEAVQPGEHGTVRRGGGNRRREGALEQRRVGGEPIQVRAGQAPVAVTAQVAGAQRVDAEQDDVGGLCHAVSSVRRVQRSR